MTCFSRCWFAEIRLKTVLAASVLTPIITVTLCYRAWLQHGCKAFMPYISDFGLHDSTKPLFSCGCLLTALSLLFSCTDAFYVRYQFLESPRLKLLNTSCLAAGLLVCGGLSLIGFVPWHNTLALHYVCAGGILLGGVPFTFCNLALLRHASMRSGCKLASVMHHLQYVCFIVLILSLMIMCCCVGIALREPEYEANRAIIVWDDNFDLFCQNLYETEDCIAALFEWILIASLLGSVGTVIADFHQYSSDVAVASHTATQGDCAAG